MRHETISPVVAIETSVEQGLSERASSYRTILKYTGIVGGASFLKLAVGVVRAKCVAMLLGPSGIGLMSMYSSILEFASTGADVGISRSAVRQVAAVSNDPAELSLTIRSLRLLAPALGTAGFLTVVLCSGLISTSTFGSASHKLDVAILGLCVLFASLSSAQTALLQGVRRISQMAASGLYSIVFGGVFTVAIIYVWRDKGIVPSIVVGAAIALFFSWIYARQIRLEVAPLHWRDFTPRAKDMLLLGSAFVVSGLTWSGGFWFLRTSIIRVMGQAALGEYQAASTITIQYVGLIFTAMEADYYPRLSLAASDRNKMSRILRDQVQVGLLLLAPAVMALSIFAPAIIIVLYSNRFGHATQLLQIMLIGLPIRVISWPAGDVMLAMGRKTLYVSGQLLYVGSGVVSALALMPVLGLVGLGLSFVISNAVYCVYVHVVARVSIGYLPNTFAAVWPLALCVLLLPPLFEARFLSQGVLWTVNVTMFVTVAAVAFYELRSRSGLTAGMLARRMPMVRVLMRLWDASRQSP